ncbi:MAG: outer membrane protein OmpK [Wenzhouxiangellaceae bacterium]|nr:outer membrane protein OmpK [Wenzhouxiangellaceae bacterium]
MRVRRFSLLLFAGWLLLAGGPAAQAQLQWQDNSLTWLYGGGFEVQPEWQHTGTFEHVSGWHWGDVFAFVDYTRFQGEADFFSGRRTWYGEISPRLSLGKLSGREWSAGPVRDVLVAATLEAGEGDVETWLLGPAVDLDVPGFDFVQLNVYRRWPNGGRDGDTWQFTPVWSLTVPLAGSQFVFDGFIDWVINSDRSFRRNLHINPQFKYDLGQRFGWRAKRLMVGLEYSYWSNRFGIADTPAFNTDQQALSLLLKSHL